VTDGDTGTKAPKKAKKTNKKKKAKKAKTKKPKMNIADPVSVVGAVVAAVKKKMKDFDTHITGAPTAYFDTGSYALNWCISNLPLSGGMPGGRVVEIFGEPSAGKSLIIYKMMADVCRRGGYIILDDTESCFQPPYARSMGVDTDRLIPMDSNTVEEHFDRVIAILKELRSKIGPDLPIMIALDSLAMLMTVHEVDTGFEKKDMSKAGQVRKGMRMLRKAMRKEPNTLYVVANHVIANIGGGKWKPRTTPGGKSVPFQCSVRLELISSKKVVEEGTKRVLGEEKIAHVVKNKIIYPFRQCRLRVMFGRGLVPSFHLYEAAQQSGVVVQGRTKDEKTGKMKDSTGYYTMKGAGKKFQAKTFYTEFAEAALKEMDAMGRDENANVGIVNAEFDDLDKDMPIEDEPAEVSAD